MKIRKYAYLYVLQGHYYGRWEDLCAEDKHGGKNQYGTPLQRIRANKRDYQENEGGQYRIVSRRELMGD